MLRELLSGDSLQGLDEGFVSNTEHANIKDDGRQVGCSVAGVLIGSRVDVVKQGLNYLGSVIVKSDLALFGLLFASWYSCRCKPNSLEKVSLP